MKVAGVIGELQWGYHRAAGVRNWDVEKGENGWSLRGSITDSNPYLDLGQRAGALVFEAPHARGAWRWPVVDLAISGASVTAVLGPKER